VTPQWESAGLHAAANMHAANMHAANMHAANMHAMHKRAWQEYLNMPQPSSCWGR